METVGAAVVAECANQYGDLQDEVGLVTDHRLFSVYLCHSVCVCYILYEGSSDDFAPCGDLAESWPSAHTTGMHRLVMKQLDSLYPHIYS